MKHKGKLYYVISILLTLALGIGIGFMTGESTANENKEPLRLNVTADPEAGFRDITAEDLNYNFDGITYVNVSEVAIEINSKTMLLEDAIRHGLVTVEQIIAQAQEDVRNRNCILKYDTNLGLSEFIYTYKDAYDIRVVYDVFECSDGKQHLISDFIVTPPSKARDLSFAYTYLDDDGAPVRLLYEDWGLEFSVTENSSTDITLRYSQWDGMASGELSVQWYQISDQNNRLLDVEIQPEITPIPLQSQTDTGHLSLNWESFYGELPRGHYYLILYVYDTYDPTAIHPLIQNYCDGQYFSIPFSVS